MSAFLEKLDRELKKASQTGFHVFIFHKTPCVLLFDRSAFSKMKKLNLILKHPLFFLDDRGFNQPFVSSGEKKLRKDGIAYYIRICPEKDPILYDQEEAFLGPFRTFKGFAIPIDNVNPNQGSLIPLKGSFGFLQKISVRIGDIISS